MSGNKRPLSVLVLVYTSSGRVLLLDRSRHPGYWQSITGSLESGETHELAARRELEEETGLHAAAGSLVDTRIDNRFEIMALWRDRYPAGVTHNDERVFEYELPAACAIRLAPDEHRASVWLPWEQAANQVFSWTNRDAIQRLAIRLDWASAAR